MAESSLLIGSGGRIRRGTRGRAQRSHRFAKAERSEATGPARIIPDANGKEEPSQRLELLFELVAGAGFEPATSGL
jgi:hypothetical protein